MENGGFLMESKKKIYDLIPSEFYPQTILIAANESKEKILRTVRENHFTFPLIVKPDIGGRGRGVKKVESEEELIPYIQSLPVDMLIQEFISYEEEIGIFYFRYPGTSKGRISGIVGKQFSSIDFIEGNVW
jgi:glutathione synthase/RimK-type ligase-like ATP-grasp enzyme